MSAMKSLAHFHALGYGMKKLQNTGSFSATYPFLSSFFASLDKDKVMIAEMSKNFKIFLADLKQTEYSDLITSFETVGPKMPSLFKQVAEKNKDFIIHGDFWANNCMFAKEPQVG